MLQVEPLICNPFAQNTFIVYDDDNRKAFAVDAGMYEESERLAFDRFLRQRELRLQFLINTHLHLDHVFGNRFVAETYRVPVYYHKADEFLLPQMKEQGELFGIPVEEIHRCPQSDAAFTGEKTVGFAGREIRLIPVPGHSPGSVVVLLSEDGICFSGDLLFRGGVGRTDLPGGNTAQLKESLRKIGELLSPDIRILPGHGLDTTVAAERKYNPFFI